MFLTLEGLVINKLTSVQVMVWCCQAASHNLITPAHYYNATSPKYLVKSWGLKAWIPTTTSETPMASLIIVGLQCHVLWLGCNELSMWLILLFSRLTTLTKINSLWPSDTIWWNRSGSTRAQVMACCLMAPSHYLNQCWLEITAIHPSEISQKIIKCERYSGKNHPLRSIFGRFFVIFQGTRS